MKTAILTGASSGLGKEYLTELVRQFPEVEQIVLIARRKDRHKRTGDSRGKEKSRKRFENVRFLHEN